jgi:Ca2+-binding EF-hand superfamily protein
MSPETVKTAIISNEKAFFKALKLIRSIDKDNNGYVTVTELDDILKICFPEEFSDKDL